ncbi:MAG: hypothetical protein ACR2HH_09335 [Chthoniobacterales bacterium]
MKRTPKTIRIAARALASLAFAAISSVSFAVAKSDVGLPLHTLVAPAVAGAQVECTMPDGRVIPVSSTTATNNNAIAVTGDDQVRCALQEGQTTFVIKLPETPVRDRYTFVNENTAAAGELKISVSNCQLPAASPKWMEVDGNTTFNHKRLFNVSLVGVEARYLRLAFTVAKSARLASLGTTGDGLPSNWAAPRVLANHQLGWISSAKSPKPSHKKERGFDYAAMRAKARIVFVSSNSSEETSRMIDHNEETSFRFAASDSRPTAIVELAGNERINRVSARYQVPSAGRLDVFLLDDLGKGSTDINYRQPIASTTEQNAEGEAVVDFDPQGARYVAVRFTPLDASAGDGFEIAEIHAYGDVPVALIDALGAPDVYVSNQGGIHFPGEITQDVSSSLGTIAVPPIIPQVSP